MSSFLFNITDDSPVNVTDPTVRPFTREMLIAEIMLIIATRPEPSFLIHDDHETSDVFPYGVSQQFETDTPQHIRCSLLASRIEKAIKYYEPRLTDPAVTITDSTTAGCVFKVSAVYKGADFSFLLKWDSVFTHFKFCE